MVKHPGVWSGVALLLVTVGVLLLLTVPAAIACDEEGGAYVRGAIWFVCVLP